MDWFAPALMDIAQMAASSDLSLHMSVYVTCLCNPEAVPPIPNCDVTIIRPSIYRVLLDLVTPPTLEKAEPMLPISTLTSAKLDIPTPTKRPATATTQATESTSAAGSEDFDPSVRDRLPWIGLGGGLAVCASGPEGLTREAANAVARLQVLSGVGNLGIVGLHTEVFAL